MPFETSWTAPVAINTTTLGSLLAGDLWHSGKIVDASPTAELVRISYQIAFTSAPTATAGFEMWIASGDDAPSGEIWPGGMAATAGKITTAQTRAEVLAALGPRHHPHDWRTDHGATFAGHFSRSNFGTAWQVVIRVQGGNVASSGAVVRYRYATTVG